MRRLFQASAALALLFAASAAAHAQSDDDNDESASLDDRPHVTMVGTASAEVVPDIADINLGVTTEKAGAADAAQANAKVAQAIVDAAKAQGVEPKDIRTQSVTLSQTFDEIHDAGGRYIGRKPRGFSASNTVVIRVRALAQAGTLAQSLIEKGATQFNGISFSVEHPQPIQDRLLGDAVRDAKRKATIAAEALGAKLGPVLLIGRPQAPSGGGLYPRPAMPMPVRAMAPAAPIPIEAGTETLDSIMEVTWALQ